MTAAGDVVVAGVMQNGIAFVVDSHMNAARPRAKGIEIGLRIEMVVKIDDRHRVPSTECRAPSAAKGDSAPGTRLGTILPSQQNTRRQERGSTRQRMRREESPGVPTRAAIDSQRKASSRRPRPG